jgi:hypothetical protein
MRGILPLPAGTIMTITISTRSLPTILYLYHCLGLTMAKALLKVPNNTKMAAKAIIL